VTTSERWSTDSGGSTPHGGTLIERRLDTEEAEALDARQLPSLTLTPAETADLRALATGAYSPLSGFMNAKEHQACADGMRLPDGTLWPIPVCLGLADGDRLGGDLVALRSQSGDFVGVLEIEDVFERDRVAEAELVYGTTDSDHPGVARVLSSPRRAVSGPIRALVEPLGGPVGR